MVLRFKVELREPRWMTAPGGVLMSYRISSALQHIACSIAGIAMCATAAAADISIGISADVTSLDPHYVATQHNVAIGWHVFDALTRVDEKARIIPGLATSWRAIDPTTWEFKLRKGVKFHDGSEFTADDVAYSLVRPLAIAGSPGGFAVYVRRIVSKQVVDPYTIRLKTATPYGAMPQDLNSIMIIS